MKNSKKLLIVLLAVYLMILGGLTVCSNQILQMTLPEVCAEGVNAQSVNGTYYNMVIRLTSVCYGNNGNPYVMVLETRETPLGKRMFVCHVPVSILEKDAELELVAVEGALERNDLIVYQGEMQLEDGEQVRIMK